MMGLVTPAAPNPLKSPLISITITGTPTQNQTLAASHGLADLDGLTDFNERRSLRRRGAIKRADHRRLDRIDGGDRRGLGGGCCGCRSSSGGRCGISGRLHHLRRGLHDQTGGMYPELVTRPDLKVFLPPIGGMTLYFFGDVSKLGQPETKVACRVHDECNGSDVFGSDICTCRPYLAHGIEICIEMAQKGGVGVVINGTALTGPPSAFASAGRLSPDGDDGDDGDNGIDCHCYKEKRKVFLSLIPATSK